jgi:pimeloyl-ACP methyl ester carboxylesterase
MNASPTLSAINYVDTSYGCIAYREQGTGPVGIFLHAFGLNAYQWRDVVPSLADQFRYIVIDLIIPAIANSPYARQR